MQSHRDIDTQHNNPPYTLLFLPSVIHPLTLIVLLFPNNKANHYPKLSRNMGTKSSSPI